LRGGAHVVVENEATRVGAGSVKVRFELLSLFRQKAGTGEIELELGTVACPAEAGGDAAPGPAAEQGRVGGPTALHALRRLEAQLLPRRLGALEGDILRRGVLLFVRSPGAPMHRILDPARESLREGQTLVLGTAMEGG